MPKGPKKVRACVVKVRHGYGDSGEVSAFLRNVAKEIETGAAPLTTEHTLVLVEGDVE